MGNQYTHLTSEERYHIYTMIKSNWSQRKIAKGMGRSQSSISRELNRNTGSRGYRHKQAHAKAQERHKEKAKSIKLTEFVTTTIRSGLKKGWSPEIICGRLYVDEQVRLHHETVYQWIYKDKAGGGDLYKHLCHAAKPYRKRYGKSDYRGRIINRKDISERPKIVDTKTRVGDWEADTVIGKGHKGGFVTIAERRTRLYLALPISHKTAEQVTQGLIALLQPIKSLLHTITYDNGREFSYHEQISKTLGCECYFAKPYHSWERGLNEQSNGLLRRFFPKTMALDQVSVEKTCDVINQLNNRPRKCLGYKTPIEVFKELTFSQFPDVYTDLINNKRAA